jgi:hypothetical protein
MQQTTRIVLSLLTVTFAYAPLQADCLNVKWSGIAGAKMNVRSSAGLLSNCPGVSSYIHMEQNKSSGDKVDTTFRLSGDNIRLDQIESVRDGAGSETILADVSGLEIPKGKPVHLQLSGFKGEFPHLSSNQLYLTVWVDGRAAFQASLSGMGTYEKK